MLNESTAARVFSSCAEHPAARRFPFVLPGTGTPYVQHRSPAGLTGLSASAARCTGIQAASRFSFLARFERAASSLPTFKPDSEALLAIGEICSRLEGIPLAIELAAARVKTLTVHQILQRTTNLLDLLHVSSGSAVQRHRTMAAVMDWSYNLLTDPERELFARLSVFHGDFSLQTAEKICHGEGIREEQILELLAGLVDKSLVEPLPTLPGARFRLHEIARQYAHQKLEESGRPVDWQIRHLDYYLHFAEQAESNLRSAAQLEWLNRLEPEQENLRAALRFVLDGDKSDNARHLDSAARLVRALWVFWFIRGQFREGRYWAERALAALQQSSPASDAIGKLLYVAASFCYFQGDLSQAQVLSEKSLNACKAASDTFGEIISLHHLGIIATSQGSPDQAAVHLKQGLQLAIQMGDAWLTAVIHSDLGSLAAFTGDDEAARQQFQRSLEIERECEDRFSIIYSLTNLARIALQHGDLKQAAMLTEETISLSRLIGERRGISFALFLMGQIALQEGKPDRAGELLKESLQIVWRTRDRDTVLEYLVALADVEVRQKRYEIAARLLAACEAAAASFPAGYRLPDQALYEHLVDKLRAQLDSGAFTAAWTLGRLMSLEQAVNFALVRHPGEPDQ